MGKRPRSASPDGGTRKRRPSASSPPRLGSRPRPLSGLFDLPELFLHVLSFLGPTDLARAQGVSRQWERMVTDPQLWKRLYLAKYTHPHESRLVYTRGSSAPSRSGRNTPMRPIARLPSRAFPPPSPSPSPGPSRLRDDEQQAAPPPVRFDGVDWRAMLRLGTNWSNGHVLAQASVPLPPSPAPTHDDPVGSHQHLALFPSFIAASSPSSPLVNVYASDGATLGLVPPPPSWSSPARPDNVTAVVADQAVAPLESEGYLPARLGIFYSSGGFAIVRLRLDSEKRFTWARESVVDTTRVRPSRRSAHRNASSTGRDPVVLAAMHSPLLLTCTLDFTLAVYTLGDRPDSVTLIRTLRSDVSFHPASLSLLPSATRPGAFRGALVFTTPVYPSSWTVAVQEIGIAIPSGSAVGATVHRGECHNVHAKWNKDVWPRRIEPVPGVYGPIGVGSDGRWCVLAGEDSVIHVYALPPELNSVAPKPDTNGDHTPAEPLDRTLGITHADTLLAPSGGVGALSLVAGRCVSGGGLGGKILVWELDETDDEWGEAGEARVGTARGRYVEVNTGSGQRLRDRKAPSAVAERSDNAVHDNELSSQWPMPGNLRSISSAARSLFLAPPPAFLPPAPRGTGPQDHTPPAVRQLAFDEEKIVSLAGDVMQIWSFR